MRWVGQARGLVEPAGGEGNSDECGQGFRFGFAHNRGAMIVHGALADLQIPSNVLAWAAGQNELKDLMLASRETFDLRRCGLPD